MSTTTPEAQQDRPVAEEDEPKALFDLTEINQRDYIIGLDGKRYYMRTDGLSATQHHRFEHLYRQHGPLFEKEKLNKTEQKQMEAIVAELLEIMLDAPKTVRDTIKGSRVRQMVDHFYDALHPELTRLQQMRVLEAMLGEALHNNSQTDDQEPEPASSTRES